MKQINYFVSYRFGGSYGRAPVACDEPIRSMSDIVAIEDYLRGLCVEGGMAPVVAEALTVVSWQRFEEETSQPRLVTARN